MDENWKQSLGQRRAAVKLWIVSVQYVVVQEVESLRQQLSNYEKDKVTLQLTKQRLLHADKQLKNIEWEKEVLSQRFAKVEAERNELFKKFEASILEVQQKTGLKGMLLERKVEALNDALEKKQTQLAEVLAASNLDSPTLQSVCFRWVFWMPDCRAVCDYCDVNSTRLRSPAKGHPHCGQNQRYSGGPKVASLSACKARRAIVAALL